MDAAARALVRQRAGGRCEYCLLPDVADEWPFHVEHVVAKQHGGNDQIDNLCWSCSRCNLHKGPNIASLDPATSELAQLFNPRQHQWAEHFAICEARIDGQTPAGRATVRLLNMNDSGRIDLRRDLIERGVF